MKSKRVFAVGVGPGAPKYVTEIVKDIVLNCDVVIGYKYTLKTIESLLDGKEVHEITMSDQEEMYQSVAARNLENKTLVVPFTGDVNFSESEVVDRLVEIFGAVEVVPGISSIQVAASRAQIPLDKSRVITMHVTSSIENKKTEMVMALRSKLNVVLVPRPWPRRPDKHFMPSQIATYLKECGFDTKTMPVQVYESLTNPDETIFSGMIKDLEGKEFSDMCVMVILGKIKPDSYMNYRWQWEGVSNNV